VRDEYFDGVCWPGLDLVAEALVVLLSMTCSHEERGSNRKKQERREKQKNKRVIIKTVIQGVGKVHRGIEKAGW